MAAYLLLLAALLSRVIPHSGWYGFTAVGGSLLYFGARRMKSSGTTWRFWTEMALPVIALAGVDYYLTTSVYNYPFHWQAYLVTWSWYAAAIILGRILLGSQVSFLRVASAALLGPTSFFLASNYSAWIGLNHPGGMYAPSFAGLLTCFAAGLPFYGRDLLSTGIVLAIAFGVPAAIRQFQNGQQLAAPRSIR